ncbi:MAG: hypothetical protein ACRDX8_07770 [Acidimicrobiales bacterium]
MASGHPWAKPHVIRARDRSGGCAWAGLILSLFGGGTALAWWIALPTQGQTLGAAFFALTIVLLSGSIALFCASEILATRWLKKSPSKALRRTFAVIAGGWIVALIDFTLLSSGPYVATLYLGILCIPALLPWVLTRSASKALAVLAAVASAVLVSFALFAALSPLQPCVAGSLC